nr:hypothetical protein [Tanacetum cinerariifolium]
MFQQHQDESLYDAWTRYKGLIQKVPHHGLNLWSKILTFFSHIDSYTQIDINYATGENLKGLSAEEAWETIEDCAQCDKQWKNPTSTIYDQTIAILKDLLVGNEVVRVKIPSCISWLYAYDEPLGDLDMMEDKVENQSPQKPQPLHSCPSLEVELGEERDPEQPIKPLSPDSFRMNEVDHLTIHTPPSLYVASFHPNDMYCYYHPCVDNLKKHYGFKPGLLRHSGSIALPITESNENKANEVAVVELIKASGDTWEMMEWKWKREEMIEEMMGYPKGFDMSYDLLVGNEVVRVKIPSCMSWLDAFDEPLGDLDMMEDKVENQSPQREIPNFDEPEPQPQPLPSCPSLEVELGEERDPKQPIKPLSPDSFRMEEVDHLTIHTPPSLYVASFHPKDMYCYYHPCVDNPKKHYGFKPGLLGHSGSIGLDFSKLRMIEDDWELESKEVSFLKRGLNSPVRPKEIENVRIKEIHQFEHIIQRPLFQHMALSNRNGVYVTITRT